MHGVSQSRFFHATNVWQIYFFASVCSILLSAWAAFKTDVINPDAICYLQSAQTLSQGLSSAIHVCGQAQWPFYSVLIFGIAHLTHFSYLAAAYSLDAFFSLISIIAFIAIVRLLTPSY